MSQPTPIYNGPLNIIDLTKDDDRPCKPKSETTSVSPTPARSFASREASLEPPQKRQRLAYKIDSISSYKKSLALCLDEQVAPYVKEEVRKVRFPGIDAYRLQLQVLSRLATEELISDFRLHNGRLSKEYETIVARRAELLVNELARSESLQLSSPPSGVTSHNATPLRTRQSGVTSPNLSVSPSLHHRSEPTDQTAVHTLGGSAAPLQQPLNTLPGERPSVFKSFTRSTYGSDAPAPYVTPVTRRSARVSYSQSLASPSSAPAASTTSPLRSSSHYVPNRPRTPKNKKPQLAPTSPQNFRSRAKDLAWRAVDGTRARGEHKARWFSVTRRPYIQSRERDQIRRGCRGLVKTQPGLLEQPHAFHVDFTSHEIHQLRVAIRRALKLDPIDDDDPAKDLIRILKKYRKVLPGILDKLPSPGEKLDGRTDVDIENFLTDLLRHDTRSRPQVLSLEADTFDKHGESVRLSSIPALLQAREITGGNALHSTRRLMNYANEFRKCREDGLERRMEWTGGAGDISTVSWVSNNGFICGTTTHSDLHNQQYNKPGNLILGSVTSGTLKAYADHRIVRPIVSKGDNSTDAMRESQDPWLYSSVVSSDYDAAHERAFTSSFDRTVKVWKVGKDSSSMVCIGTWKHGGNVNFVEASRHVSGLVATAADVPAEAVRIYNVNEHNVSESSFQSFSCLREVDLEGNLLPAEKWAYFPAAMRWGVAESVRHMLLVGYSPRSLTGDDNDIPEDKSNTGEICLWNGLTGERVKITTVNSLNVFEVMWHPSQPSFIVATSAARSGLEDGIRTQVRIFTPNADLENAYCEVKALDCPALDINELTMKPNSFRHCYITAGCTDGNVYVWDTAQGDRPMHVLKHGACTEELSGDREREDTGVKFTAWGTTPDRFYSGSSDGVVKVWNIRSSQKPRVRDLLEVPAQVSYGVFSPDSSKLVIGDASGRVTLLSIGDDEEKPPSFTKITVPGGGVKLTRRPQEIKPHDTPAPPTYDASGALLEEKFDPWRPESLLASGQLRIHPDRVIGAVQGPNYADSNLFCREAHLDRDPAMPLLARFEVLQQEAIKFYPGRSKVLKTRDVKGTEESEEMHSRNREIDFDFDSLLPETQMELLADRAELNLADLDSYSVEEEDEFVFSDEEYES